MTPRSLKIPNPVSLHACLSATHLVESANFPSEMSSPGLRAPRTRETLPQGPTPMLRAWKILVASLLALCTWVDRGMAAVPTVESVTPGVGPRGGDFAVLFTGGRLKDARDILFYDCGLALKKLEVASDNEVKATLVASADCRIGAHPLRLRTPGGLSEMKVVHVSPFPVIAEVEPNDGLKEATAVGLNTTISGVIDSGDVDSFVVTLRKGCTALRRG